MLFAPAPPPADSAAALRTALLADRQRTLAGLYQRTFPLVRRHVRRHGGSAQDAQDVFQDAVVVLYEKAVAGTLVLTASPGTYLVGVSRHLWQRELTRRRRHAHAPLDETQHELPDAAAEAEPAVPVLDFVEQLGARCKSILLSFYYFRQPLEQIALDHDYRSVRSATVQKFKCLERLRQSVRAGWAELVNA